MSGIAMAMAIGACGAGSTVTGNGVAAKGYIPPDRYDAVIFLCPSALLLPDCRRAATVTDIAAVRRLLLTDSGVRGVAYVSEDQAVALERRTLTLDPQLVHPGDLPAWFSVAFAHTGFIAFHDRYASAPGVEAVQRCSNDRPVCEVAALRAVGVLP